MTGRDIGAQYGAMSRNRTEAKPIRIEHSHINHGPKKNEWISNKHQPLTKQKECPIPNTQTNVHGDTDTSAITSGAMSHTFLLKTVDVRVLGGFQKL